MKKPTEVWKAVHARLGKMTDQQRSETLKDAGIITRKGNVAAVYSSVIKVTKGSVYPGKVTKKATG